MTVSILQGDCLEVLKTLPDESIQCGVTSPPYYGLRDYGTAKWEGGDPDCYHLAAKEKSRYDYPMQEGSRHAEIAKSTIGTDGAKWKDICPDCGAHKLDNQIGLEVSPEEYVAKLVEIFREFRRVLKPDGTLWLNLGDSYAGSGGAGGDYAEGGLKEGQPSYSGTGKQMRDAEKRRGTKSTLSGGKTNPLAAARMPSLPATGNLKPKDLIGIPWMVAFALRADGWYLRSDIIWNKPNPMPESVTDRPTKSHEHIFLFSKSRQYYYDAEAIKEEGISDRPDMATKGIRTGLAYLQQGPHPNNSAYSFARKVNEEPGPGQPNQHREDREDIVYAGTRNKRDVWTVTTKPYKGAHFATFPPDLIEPCILAGTSEKGECPKCGKAWKRVVEDNSIKDHDGETQTMYQEGSTANRLALLRQAARERGEEYSSARRTLGWKPQCDCVDNEDHEGPLIPIPQTVMDIFNGSGTTGATSIKYNRSYIGIELNPKYIDLTNERLSEIQPVLALL